MTNHDKEIIPNDVVPNLTEFDILIFCACYFILVWYFIHLSKYFLGVSIIVQFSGVQGVSQYFGHLAKCKFLASESPLIKIVDIFREPGQF